MASGMSLATLSRPCEHITLLDLGDDLVDVLLLLLAIQARIWRELGLLRVVGFAVGALVTVVQPRAQSPLTVQDLVAFLLEHPQTFNRPAWAHPGPPLTALLETPQPPA